MPALTGSKAFNCKFATSSIAFFCFMNHFDYRMISPVFATKTILPATFKCGMFIDVVIWSLIHHQIRYCTKHVMYVHPDTLKSTRQGNCNSSQISPINRLLISSFYGPLSSTVYLLARKRKYIHTGTQSVTKIAVKETKKATFTEFQYYPRVLNQLKTKLMLTALCILIFLMN